MVTLDMGQDYSAFQNTFVALGGTKRTPVFLSPALSGSGPTILAIFPEQAAVLQVRPSSLATTFSADFPQAVTVTNIIIQ